MSVELFKTAADTLEAQAAEISQLKGALATKVSENVKLAQHIAQTKEAKAPVSAAVAPLAKAAAARLHERGMFNTDARRDEFAANVLDHGKALEALAKVAAYLPDAPKVGEVVMETSAPLDTADGVWARHIMAAKK
jgi:chorismate mutase